MIALLVATMAALVEPHMIMATPKPYGNPDNSPLTSSNYPCKVTSDPASFYKTAGIIDQNTMVAGENQTLSFSVSNALKSTLLLPSLRAAFQRVSLQSLRSCPFETRVCN